MKAGGAKAEEVEAAPPEALRVMCEQEDQNPMYQEKLAPVLRSAGVSSFPENCEDVARELLVWANLLDSGLEGVDTQRVLRLLECYTNKVHKHRAAADSAAASFTTEGLVAAALQREGWRRLDDPEGVWVSKCGATLSMSMLGGQWRVVLAGIATENDDLVAALRDAYGNCDSRLVRREVFSVLGPLGVVEGVA